MESGKGPNRIEDIKRHLYDREDTVSNRPHEGVLHPIRHDVSPEWNKDPSLSRPETPYKKPGMSFVKKFFIGAIIFFICALGFAAFMYKNGGASVSNSNIDLKVLGNAFTKGGESLPLKIEITNRNGANLELVNLIIEYPRGASDNTSEMVRPPRIPVGTVGAGQTVIKDINVTLYGEEKSVRKVKIKLEYHPAGSNAIFNKSENYPVTISAAPLSLIMEAPESITSEQNIELKITASLNTAIPDKNTALQVDYPSGFIFDSATPNPTFGTTMWSLSALGIDHPVTVTIRGRMIGSDGEEQSFRAYAGAMSSRDQSYVDVVYNSLQKTIKITKPFLETHLIINGEDRETYTASGGNTVNATVTWINNLSTQVSDAQIIVTLSGNAYDKTAVNPLEGYFDSLNNQIIWDKNTISELGSIEPGGSGSVSFNFKPTALISTALKDPQVALDVSIKGRKPEEGSTFSDVKNFSKKIIKISSDFQLAARVNYKSGSLPPKAETETQYQVTWTLSNSANGVSSAQARAVLPTYIKWVGASTSKENISYNEGTREVIWNIGTVAARTGFGTNREVTFTLSLIPSTSQVGSVPQLVKEVILTGKDSFTGANLKSIRPPLTTSLSNDPNNKASNDRVVN